MLWKKEREKERNEKGEQKKNETARQATLSFELDLIMPKP